MLALEKPEQERCHGRGLLPQVPCLTGKGGASSGMSGAGDMVHSCHLPQPGTETLT